MNSVEDFYVGAEGIVGEFDRFMQKHGLVGRVKADHICYKCSGSESFVMIRTAFEPGETSKWVYQSIISKRRIALIRSRRTIETVVGPVDLIELSDQKPDGSQTEGFDHIEIYPTQGTYDGLVRHLEDRGVRVKEVVRPHHTTHDIEIPGGYLVRLTRESLFDKVPAEMVMDRV